MNYKKDLVDIKEKDSYLESFAGKEIDPDPIKNEKVKFVEKQRVALEKALDIRKFEIDLYWKRGTYFWAFIAISFTSYFIVLAMDVSESEITKDSKNEILFVLNIFGLFLSTSWLFVNKGSKYWQENWEKHVDLLEDDIMGPLYKTTVRQKGFRDRIDPLKSYPYSVGKINQLISFVVIFLWALLLIRFITNNLTLSLQSIFSYYSIISLFFIGFFFVLFFCTKSSETNGDVLDMKRREIE